MATQRFPELSDFTTEELIFMADEHDDASFAKLLGGHPALKSEPGFHEFLTGIPDPFANMAFGMNLPNAEERVLSMTQRLLESNCPAYFWVGPYTKPNTLPEILIENGWTHMADSPCLVINIDEISAPPHLNDFELRTVTNAIELEVWHDLIANGFGLIPEVAALFNLPTVDEVQLYTAYLGDVAVGTTALVTNNGIAGIYCVSTLPEFRGRGVGALLTILPLLEARENGYHVGTLQASKMGLPLYLKLGFQEVCKLKMFGFGLP
jgi:GNAT superfamily N-acetyltransferase